MKKHLTTILFLGAIWGLLEATLGYVLHFLPALISGSILFPIATLVMLRTYQVTNSKKSVFGVAVTASLIKSVNLLMPNLSVWKVINPMISILVEALLVVAVLGVLSSNKVLPKIIALPLVSITWRAIFLGALAIQYTTGAMAVASPLIASTSSIVDFAIVSGLLSGAIATLIYFAHTLWIQKTKVFFATNRYAAISTFVLAVATTIAVNFI
ncbi:MAG: hypothetical protein KKE16_00630 [Firmicutes bacterium]|nr:hypothetical protein [Bacillota bacterium]